MKKRFIASAVAVLLAVGFASGCGCNSKQALSFNNNFAGGETEPTPGYTETLIYKVSKDENGDFKKDPSITDDLVKYDFNGLYTTTLKVITDSEKAHEFETDIQKSSTTENLYYLTTKLELDVSYDFSGEDKDYTNKDIIENHVYFLSKGNSYQPLFAYSTANYTGLGLSGENSKCITVAYERKVTYKTGDYYDEMKSVSYEAKGEKKDLPHDFTSKSVKYSQKSAIDNSQLLFALRNLSLSVDATYNILTVSNSYEEPTELTVKNENEPTLQGLTIKYKGTECKVDIPTKKLSYAVNSTDTSGAKQFVYVQKDKVKFGEIEENKAVMVKYTAPLISTYGSFTTLGTLVYDLIEINY